jgi:hypothetical protein
MWKNTVMRRWDFRMARPLINFRLYSDGGAIEVTVNDHEDSQNVQAIRSHLTHIVTMFSNGDFSIPMFVHDQVPPGVPVMKEKHAEISYSFEELPTGGRVRIIEYCII